MTHHPLGELDRLHEMINQLFREFPEEACYRPLHPELQPLAWYYGFANYRETLWLREIVQEDEEITARVRDIFHVEKPEAETWKRLPPREHLMNWALELQEENLVQLANPNKLPNHPLLHEGRLLPIILQEISRIYEQMLVVANEYQLQHALPHLVTQPLQPAMPDDEGIVSVSQGHYRVGAKGDPAAFDNELPTQIMDLSSYRIDDKPVSNARFLAFMEVGGYEDPSLWSVAGWQWRQLHQPHPHHWRQDNHGNWFGIGLNGAVDLVPDEPVVGLSHYTAEAYANWTSQQGGTLHGAVLQHEYQWEAATRTQAIKNFGRAWEWCSNPFKPYTGYLHSPYYQERTLDFDNERFVIRGASLHTQPALRRLSLRNRANPWQDYHFIGMRLVYPPLDSSG